ncbi:MAG: hypothetical protein LLF96_08365 [Eubacteriales bacterium]|nr:hypothetical protein [Eubacteriales bacterium]
MKKSILLISYHFAPQNAIGAVRPTKLAKYLTRMGYDVTVLCGAGTSPVRDPMLARDLRELRDVHVIHERSLLRWWKTRGHKPEGPAALESRPILPQSTLSDAAMRERKAVQDAAKPTAAVATGKPLRAGAIKLKRLLFNALYLWLDDRADAAFARACMRKLFSLRRHYDVVLSTYGPLSAHTVARKAKQAGLADRWIADFRDEAAVPFSWQKRRLAHYVQDVRLNADAVTAVSAGCLQIMGLEAFGQVIHNGFDAEDLVGLAIPPKHSERLTFIHCGQMYGTQRDLSPFFHALRELIDEGAVDASRVALIYAGWDTGGFVSQATAAGLADCLKGYGFLPRDEALKLQKAAHVLLLAAWNYKDRQGNLPGKFLEYLMLDMPVLCCVTGDTPDSEIAGVMRRTRAGFCYEQANVAQDGIKLKAYVRELYAAFTETGSVPFSPDAAQIAAFGYAGVAEAFAGLVESV